MKLPNRDSRHPAITAYNAAVQADEEAALRAGEKARLGGNATRLTGGFNVTCSRCSRSFSSSADYHTHVLQGCRR